MYRNAVKFVSMFFIMASLQSAFAFWDKVHKNLPEESFLYMEFQGTNQMRWAADYLKAKGGGRYSGSCVNINYTPAEMGQGDNTQCGAIGIHRVGGVKIDYLQDNFIDHLFFFSWSAFGNNITTYTHFINLKFNNASGDQVVTNNYNSIDGFSYNGTYGFQEFGSIDSLIATGFGSSPFTINIPGCTHANCAEWTTAAAVMQTNPIVDYQQNGSTTPLGSPSTNKQLGTDDGTNYNCYSDTAVIGACPDKGTEVGGTYQIPNVQPGGASGNAISFFTGNEDWVIWEPAYNAATFYFNEAWLEGLNSRNHSLQTAPIVGRYYNVSGDQILYYALANHYAGDVTQISHIWVTSGYNHSDYESFADDNYGTRTIGGSDGNKNYENYSNSQAYANARQNRYNMAVGNVHKIIIEQAFYTYYIRYRSGYDKMTTSNTGVWKNAVIWAIQNSTAEMALINEKAVMDLRKCRNGPSCNNS
jgi:hypothetical protein